MTKKIIFATFCIWLLFPRIFIGQNIRPKSNLQIFQDLAREIIVELFSHVETDSVGNLIIRSNSLNRQADWLIENEFIKFCVNHHIPVSMAEKPESERDFLIEFLVSDVKIEYSKLNKRNIERSGHLLLDVRIEKGLKKQVVLSEIFSKSCSDTITEKQISQVSNGQYPFTQAELSKSRNWKSWINPAIVFLSTGAVVYSFFALRSK